MSLAILLRNCGHDNNATSTTYIRYALKADTVAINIAKSPIQIPIPQQAPEIIDLGLFRPAISIGGLVDNVGLASTTTSGFENMESMSITRKYWASTSNYTDVSQTYYVPYKNKLEETLYKWMASADQELELEIGDANFPVYNVGAETNGASPAVSTVSGTNSETGGAVYVVALQTCRISQNAGAENRWEFQMQFICKSRADVTF
tara:strand:- start:5657 stop:6271 length:615 start_codon:yes stop_codon:yes gene_type:complete